MAFEWLNNFQQRTEKEPDYAKKKLAAYRLGMKAKGAITGVMIQTSRLLSSGSRIARS